MAPKLREPIHPGEILYEDFMKPLGVSINELAREIAVPPNRIVKPAPFLDDQRIVKQPELFEALG